MVGEKRKRIEDVLGRIGEKRIVKRRVEQKMNEDDWEGVLG
jgi:hypothetical protein